MHYPCSASYMYKMTKPGFAVHTCLILCCGCRRPDEDVRVSTAAVLCARRCAGGVLHRPDVPSARRAALAVGHQRRSPRHRRRDVGRSPHHCSREGACACARACVRTHYVIDDVTVCCWLCVLYCKFLVNGTLLFRFKVPVKKFLEA